MIRYIILVIFFSISLYSQDLKTFDKYFEDCTMRIDYCHVGDANSDVVAIDRIYKQGIWAGSTKNLIDNFNNGKYYAKIYLPSSQEPIFTRGYDSYFAEYQTTDPAIAGVKRVYHETVRIPYPKQKVKLVIEKRDKKIKLAPLFSCEIDPASVDISEEPLSENVKVFTIVKNGDPHQKVDIAFIAEGYTADQEEKFKTDAVRFATTLLEREPYKTYRTNFNIYGVFKPSVGQGCDEPERRIFKNTVLSSTFNSLGSERYLMTEDNKSLRDIAGHAPYDALCILVNHKRYGGGGIYNLYASFPIDNEYYVYLMIHEFGHSFGGVADEYYTSSTSYNDFFALDVEPVEPNITTLLDPKNLKWKDLVASDTPLPTPWLKKEYDEMIDLYKKMTKETMEKIGELRRNNSPEEEIQKWHKIAERIVKEFGEKMDQFFEKSVWKDKVGAYEGAGYVSKGMYRPMLDCIMFNKGDKPYCKVCHNAIVRMIHFYAE